LEKYINKVKTKDSIEVDYTNAYYGHSFSVSESINSNPYIFYGHGFYSGRQLIGSRRLKVGDILLLPLKDNKIGKYFILEIKYESDPVDMYWATLVGIGYK